MKVLEIISSKERCTESGWDAWDILLDEKMDDHFIVSLKPLGSFLYLAALKAPFFKIETDHYLLKGVRGDTHFRLAAHCDFSQIKEKVQDYINANG